MRDKIIISKLGWTLMVGSTLAMFISQNPAIAAPEAPPAPLAAYARVADLVTAVPAIATARVRSLTPVPRERAPGLAADNSRFLVSAETMSLIRGNDVLSQQIGFLIDLPTARYPKAPKWKGRSYLLFGQTSERVDFFQLASSSAILPWSSENEALVRRIAGQFAASDAPPAISKINSAFHVQGTVQGEGETQIFLETARGNQISLSIVRRPDEAPIFGAALGEVVDEAAALPAADTPLWYRLACGLPDRLPASALDGQEPAQASAATRDYRAFVEAMAPCNRAATPLP